MVISGPTASGKSSLALELAKILPLEIINCDSVQVYQGFDIGSAKASQEDKEKVTHHLLDITTWDKPLNVSDYVKLARNKIQEVLNRQKIPCVVGGSQLYLRALFGENFHQLPSDSKVREKFHAFPATKLYKMLQEKDPQRALEIHPNDHFRLARALEIISLSGGKTIAELTSVEKASKPFLPSRYFILNPKAPQRDQAIKERVQTMLAGGWIEEVKALVKTGCPSSAIAMQSIGYKEIMLYLEGKIADFELEEKIRIATRRFAHRQMKWFLARKEGTLLNHYDQSIDLSKKILEILSQ